MNQKDKQQELIELTVRWLEGYEEARRHVTSDVILSDFRKEAAENYNDSVLVPAGLGWMEEAGDFENKPVNSDGEVFVKLTKQER